MVSKRRWQIIGLVVLAVAALTMTGVAFSVPHGDIPKVERKVK